MKSHFIVCQALSPHTLMCRDVQKPQGASWCGHPPTHSCALRDHWHRMCVQRESENKILLVTAKEKTPEARGNVHGTPRACPNGLWGFKHRGQPAVAIPWVLYQAQPLAPLTARLVQHKENLVQNLLHPLALVRSLQEPPRTQLAVYIM